MAKKQQGASAAERREQVRQQRQQRLDAGQNTPNQSRGRRARRRASSGQSPWFLIGGILVMVVVVIGIFLYLARQQNADTITASSAVLKTITTIDPKVLASVGTGSAQNLLHPLPASAPSLKGPTGKPQVLYMGANYCPFCAAQRWAIIVALSRFGTFGPLDQLTSSELNVPTYTFHKSTYTSQYIDFVAVETQDNDKNPLDTLTLEQTRLAQVYDAPPYTSTSSAGSIPFLLIGNQETSTGSYFSPQVLVDVSYEDIAKQLKDPNTDIAKGVLGSANYLTAAICKVTNNQPANVCTADPVPQIQQSLSKALVSPRSLQLGLVAAPHDMVVRRQEQ